MEWTSLNVCQRLLRQWDAVHPYNAAHVMRISGRPDPDALESHWRSTLAELGLGAVSTRRGQFRWTPVDGADGEPKMVRRLAAGTSLDRFLSAELGARFDHDRELPFRAFVLEEADRYWAGVIYHHWVADSVSIRVLVREWFLRMFDPSQARRGPLEIATAGYWRSFGPGRRHWSLLGSVREMGRWLGQLRTTRRLSASDVRDLRTHVTVHPAPEGLIGAVASQARHRRVTVNDVFLCVLAEVCDEFVRAHGTPRGRDLALGTIVDLRARAAAAGEEFGLFLGFTSVICRSEEIADFDCLLRAVHRQSAHHKRSATAEASMLRMLGALAMGRLLSRRQLLEFYRRRVALAGGISNVSLNGAWPARYHPRPLLEYVRISPCGPMLPVIVTPTTLGDRLNFGLTCRESVISSAQAAEMATMFVSRLQSFAGV
ncbi:MAG: hypothetical protein ACREK4_00160 [Candidatus Rokuibacteriota bacterium]